MKKLIMVLMSIVICLSLIACEQKNTNTIDNSKTTKSVVEDKTVTPIVKEKSQYFANKMLEVFNGKELSIADKKELDGYVKKYWNEADWSKNEFNLTKQDRLIITQLFLAYDKMNTFVFFRDENKTSEYKNSKSVYDENVKLMQQCKDEATKYLNKIKDN